MSSYISPAIRNHFELLPIDLKNKILSLNIRLENLQDLTKTLESITSEEYVSYLPDVSNISSATECTGLMQTPPLNEEEYESYQEIYHIEIPKEK